MMCHCMIWYVTVHCHLSLCTVVCHCMLWCVTVLCWCVTVRYSVSLYAVLCHCTFWCYCTLWCVTVHCGMSLYTVVCHCTLWYVIVQNIAVTYAGTVFGGDYVYSTTNFVGINVRSVATWQYCTTANHSSYLIAPNFRGQIFL